MNRNKIDFRDFLSKRGHFATAPRMALFYTLQNNEALTVTQLIAHLSKYNPATVYRNIKTFEDLGIINRLWFGWKYKLELSNAFQEHHHHARCTACGLVIALSENAALENSLHLLALESNFALTDHDIELRGLCQPCQLKDPG